MSWQGVVGSTRNFCKLSRSSCCCCFCDAETDKPKYPSTQPTDHHPFETWIASWLLKPSNHFCWCGIHLDCLAFSARLLLNKVSQFRTSINAPPACLPRLETTRGFPQDLRQTQTRGNRSESVVPIYATTIRPWNQNESSPHCVPINPLSNNSFVVRLKIPYITRPFFFSFVCFFVALYYYHLPMFVHWSLLRTAIPEDTHMISAIWHYSNWDHLQLSTYRWAFSVHKSSFVRPRRLLATFVCECVPNGWMAGRRRRKRLRK